MRDWKKILGSSRRLVGLGALACCVLLTGCLGVYKRPLLIGNQSTPQELLWQPAAGHYWVDDRDGWLSSYELYHLRENTYQGSGQLLATRHGMDGSMSMFRFAGLKVDSQHALIEFRRNSEKAQDTDYLLALFVRDAKVAGRYWIRDFKESENCRRDVLRQAGSGSADGGTAVRRLRTAVLLAIDQGCFEAGGPTEARGVPDIELVPADYVQALQARNGLKFDQGKAQK